jgi:hypothetical protein
VVQAASSRASRPPSTNARNKCTFMANPSELR